MSQDRPPNEEAQKLTPDEEATPEVEVQNSVTHAPMTDQSQPEISGDASYLRKLGFMILMSHNFERIMGAIIGVNFVVVIVEIDSNAKDVEPADWVWYASWGLLASFVLELVTKLFVLRSQFWRERWNVFDFMVIAIDSTFSLLEVLGLSFLNVSMLRILRLSRLARATKVFRMFPELKLMMAGLTGAVNAIFWGTVLLFVALLVWSVLAVQFIHPLNKEIHAASDVYADCQRCPRAYESTFQACLTFTTQIVAGDSWGRETQPVIEAYPVTAVFFLTVYVSVGLAIMNLILGVVVNVATEARDRLLKEEADEKLLMANEGLSALLAMCQDMDDDGNDELTFEEIKEGFDNHEAFRNTLLDMDIGRDDLQIVWTILDSDKSGAVTSKEFVNQIWKMKNSDSQFMLAYIKFYITEIKDKLRGDLSKLGTKLTHLESELDDEMQNFDHGMGVVQHQVADVAGSAQIIKEQVQKIDENTEGMRTQVVANQTQIAANTRRIDADVVLIEKRCECGSVFISDANFCAKCGRSQVYEAQPPPIVERRGEPAVNPNVLGQPVSREVTNLIFDSGSLKELLENVHFTDLGEAPWSNIQLGSPSQLGSLGRSNVVGDHVEMLARLEHVWQQCIVSIDDMRNFHMSLADLLESIVRRLSITIHHTVSASVTTSTSRIPGMIRSATQLSEAAGSALAREHYSTTKGAI